MEICAPIGDIKSAVQTTESLSAAVQSLHVWLLTCDSYLPVARPCISRIGANRSDSASSAALFISPTATLSARLSPLNLSLFHLADLSHCTSAYCPEGLKHPDQNLYALKSCKYSMFTLAQAASMQAASVYPMEARGLRPGSGRRHRGQCPCWCLPR